MAEALERQVVIELLNKLGSDQDEEVLEAARQAHARVTAAGLSWEDLLVPEESEDDDLDEEDFADEEDEEEEDGELDEPEPEAEESPAERAEKNAPSLQLIEKLLAKSDISETLREELDGYKADIADGEFDEGDRRYLRALEGRLSKGR